MAKRGRIPKETKEKGEKKTYNLLSETIYMVVYHSKQSQNARRTKKSAQIRAKKKRNFTKRENTVFFPSLYGFLISLVYRNVVQKDQSLYSARLKRKETQPTSIRQVTCT